jgi:hypothetical protein
MFLKLNWIVILSLISTFMVFAVTVIIARMKNKQQIHYAFLCANVAMFIWTTIRLLQLMTEKTNSLLILEKLHYIGVCFLPVALFLQG